MYEYFKELENLRDFKTYLVRNTSDRKQDIVRENIPFSDNLLKELEKLFPKLNIIDQMIDALNEDLVMNTLEYKASSYEKWINTNGFFEFKNEQYFESHNDLNKKIDLTFSDLQFILNNLIVSINYLVELYPKYKEFLLNTQKEIKMILNEIDTISTIILPPKEEGVTINWPNSWYITPNGYLYNTGLGHKRGNLKYSFYYEICDFLEHNQKVTDINNYSHISNILKRGYITSAEFQNYAHLIYKLPTIITPEIEYDINCCQNLLEMNEENYRKITSSINFRWPQIERSYQKNLITLITGHLAAETELYQSFMRMNNSSNKNDLIKQLKYLTRNDLGDVLVRFSRFHKIESIIDNTITTSSLNGIHEFSCYLKKGWNLHIISGIIYDKSIDKLSEVDFNSYFVRKHLDSELEKYEGKGKILIKDKWIN